MTNPPFDDVWRSATGLSEPFPYQRRLGTEDWPDVLAIPTGLGKTAAVGLSWIYKRMTDHPETPRRLVYCLPMRVLVEQTVDAFSSWLANLDLLGKPGEGRVSVSVLMGGEPNLRQANWALYPEEAAVLVGTQDMLLSRALMRGYGMSRYQWPMHFALLHNDALWVFDEIQLMGPALSTSAQLDGFRRRSPGAIPSRSLWLSATLREEWLSTVDFREQSGALNRLEVSGEDERKAGDRLNAVKRLHRADVVLDRETAKANAKAYVTGLADAVLERHEEGHQTLVILNRVDRAQRLARRLHKNERNVPVLLVHARFRAAERNSINDDLRRDPEGPGRIIIATQAVEAGVDISSRTLFTELAPWSSMVQRFGRCNRYGEHDQGADVYWIDISEDADEALPYDDSTLAEARRTVEGLSEVGPASLPPVSSERPFGHVIRWKDLIDLFDIDPDLSGFDIDIAPYIRDQGTPQVQVFWRSFEGRPSDQPDPIRDELCPVSMGQIEAYLKKKIHRNHRRCWIWDPLIERWEEKDRRSRLVPGSTLLLRAADGGYDPSFGFVARSTDEVSVIQPATDQTGNEAYGDDAFTRIGRFVELAEHIADVVSEIRKVAAAVQLDDGDTKTLETVALWHDLGKAHPAFQRALLDFAESDEAGDTLWAKSSGSGRLRYRIEHGDDVQERPHFRHELASMLAWLSHAGDGADDIDLVAYLIAAHHGKVRMGLRALPAEPQPPDDLLFARGVWDGDVLPAISLDGIDLPETTLRLEIMRLGRSEMGRSWTERTRRLLDAHGPFRLAWLEALIRVADWRGSAAAEDEDA